MPDPTQRANPAWTRDELILALNLYVQFKGNPPGKASDGVVALSDLLNKMDSQITQRASNFRNANGVYMKVMNFRRFDPAYIAEGKKGLQRGNKLEADVWSDFSNDHAKLVSTANAIRLAVVKGQIPVASEEEDEEVAEAEEGRILTRLHKTRERSRKLVEKKKAAALKSHGCLKCEACGFDFKVTYGLRGATFIEVHHTKPVHTLVAGDKTRLEDLSLLCSNCHRIVHVQRPWLTIEKLKHLLERDASPWINLPVLKSFNDFNRRIPQTGFADFPTAFSTRSPAKIRQLFCPNSTWQLS
jgi:5-methylcytosine-specific restriction enzyme A